MKYFILLLSLSTFANAHVIQGNPILKGSLKTKLMIGVVEATCRVEVEKVKNLMQEDAFGNPAYRVRLEINVSGKEKKEEVKISRNVEFVNLFQEGSTLIVKDFDYYAKDGSTLKIKADGRLESLTLPLDNQKITCSF